MFSATLLRNDNVTDKKMIVHIEGCVQSCELISHLQRQETLHVNRVTSLCVLTQRLTPEDKD